MNASTDALNTWVEHEIKKEKRRHFDDLVEEWNGQFQKILTTFANKAWRPAYKLGVIPVKTYRFRTRQVSPATYLWRVERPLETDKTMCDAYQLQLTLDAHWKPKITFHSGRRTYNIMRPLCLETLEAIIVQAVHDPPMRCSCMS